MLHVARLLSVLVLLFAARDVRALVGDGSCVVFGEEAGTFPILRGNDATPLLVSSADWFGVQRVAGDLASDVERVGGAKPAVCATAPDSGNVIVVGTIGRSPWIDQLVAAGKLDVSEVKGKWESWVMQVVEAPYPGVQRALVIAGSDKRGAIYGAYHLSEQMGVSPWYWWADVVPQRREQVHVRTARLVFGAPSVKYRGIFINDEAPVLSGWVTAKFGQVTPRAYPPVSSGVANYGREFYARVFELLLRLRANYLWPAMWNNAFNEDDLANASLADAYGIVMGTSHQEPMMRAQKEWDRRFQAKVGSWNYAKHPRLLEEFWREGVRRNKDFENIYTIGLRGANDTEMAPGGPAANRTMLERIVAVQRKILSEEVHADITRVPQLWCLYKEVQEYYEDGMRVPDDVTLLWADDNWGNLRRVPVSGERRRAGGAGVYYHFDYVGGPRNYKWTDTNPLPKIWEQMSLAAMHGADRLWIVNVGDLKGFEHPLEFFLSMAWDTARWNGTNLSEYARARAAREFGAEHAAEIADILERAGRAAGRRKPEMLRPDTYSVVHYGEAERIVAEYRVLVERAEKVMAALPAVRRDSFYQLVLYPVKSCAVVNALYYAAGRNALYASQGRAADAAEMERLVRSLFETDKALSSFYNNTLAGGRWKHFADQPKLGYTGWNSPKADSLDHIKLVSPAIPAGASLGVAVDGAEKAWPGPAEAPSLPVLDSLNQQSTYLEVFNRGSEPFTCTVEARDAWVHCSEASFEVTRGKRVRLSIDWDKAPKGDTQSEVRVAGAGAEVRVRVRLHNPTQVTRDTLRGHAEAHGVVTIEPANFSQNRALEGSGWKLVEGYGRTQSGMRAEGRWDEPGFVTGRAAPHLEYPIYVQAEGTLDVHLVLGPLMNITPGRTVRVGLSLNDDHPQELVVVKGDYQITHGNQDWGRVVGDNARVVRGKLKAKQAGQHVLKVWMLDPGPVLQRILVDRGGLKPSYLGPVESYRGRQ